MDIPMATIRIRLYDNGWYVCDHPKLSITMKFSSPVTLGSTAIGESPQLPNPIIVKCISYLKVKTITQIPSCGLPAQQ